MKRLPVLEFVVVFSQQICLHSLAEKKQGRYLKQHMKYNSAWYAVFVKTGQENLVKERLDYRFKGNAVMIEEDHQERKGGKWFRRVRNLFPGTFLFMA